MASEVSICNLALLAIGEGSITSLSDNNNRAINCKAVYADLRDAVLEEYDWTFAIGRKTLPKSATAPDFYYGSKFELPSDVLRVIFATDSPTDENGISKLDWRREGQFIVASTDAMYIKYVKAIIDTSVFSPLFVQALAARISMELAIPLAGSKPLRVAMEKLYDSKLIDASASDGRQGKSDRIRAQQFIEVR